MQRAGAAQQLPLLHHAAYRHSLLADGAFGATFLGQLKAQRYWWAFDPNLHNNVHVPRRRGSEAWVGGVPAVPTPQMRPHKCGCCAPSQSGPWHARAVMRGAPGCTPQGAGDPRALAVQHTGQALHRTLGPWALACARAPTSRVQHACVS